MRKNIFKKNKIKIIYIYIYIYREYFEKEASLPITSQEFTMLFFLQTLIFKKKL